MSESERFPVDPLREALRFVEPLLIARHNSAHNGDIVNLGPIETCGICGPVLAETRAALASPAAPRPEGLHEIADRLAEAVLTWESGHRVEAIAQEYQRARLSDAGDTES